jgi:hypothetical protein
VYVEARFNQHELFHGTYLMVNGEYQAENIIGWEIAGEFGWVREYRSAAERIQWEQFTDWLWYRFPAGVFLS